MGSSRLSGSWRLAGLCHCCLVTHLAVTPPQPEPPVTCFWFRINHTSIGIPSLVHYAYAISPVPFRYHLHRLAASVPRSIISPQPSNTNKKPFVAINGPGVLWRKCSLIINSFCTSAADRTTKCLRGLKQVRCPPGETRCLSCVNHAADQQLQPIASGKGKNNSECVCPRALQLELFIYCLSTCICLRLEYISCWVSIVTEHLVFFMAVNDCR